jgi:hypothetical protein
MNLNQVRKCAQKLGWDGTRVWSQSCLPLELILLSHFFCSLCGGLPSEHTPLGRSLVMACDQELGGLGFWLQLPCVLTVWLWKDPLPSSFLCSHILFSPPLAFSYFLVGSCFFCLCVCLFLSKSASDCHPPSYVSHIAGRTGMRHCTCCYLHILNDIPLPTSERLVTKYLLATATY